MENFKKKKKKSFLQRQKRLARNGCYGKGTQLSPDMYEYFINIIKVMNTKKDEEEEMEVLSSNVLNELKGKETEYSCNQIASRVIENLLPHVTNEEFLNFINNLNENLRPLFTDVFGSHVLQQTLVVAYNKYVKGLQSNADDKSISKFYDYIVKISNFLFNNLEDFIWDTYSNAVARTVFNVLSGHPVKGEIKPAELEVKIENEVKLPGEFQSIIVKFCKKILSWPHFSNMCNQPVNSSFLQSLLLASRKLDECSDIIDKIISFYGENSLDFTDETNSPFVRLVEVVLSLSDEKRFKKIYKAMFKHKLVELATSKCGNFAVQRLISNCRQTEIFEKIFAKVSSHMEDVLSVDHYGVLLALVKECRNLGILQGDCMAMLTRVFQAEETKNLVPLILSLKPSSNLDPETSEITLHGALIVQEILNFKKPINVVNSLLEMPDAKLVKLLCDVRGSHITDAFVSSSSIGEKSRDRLFNKLKGHYLNLATSKHGSRSLDSIWAVINIRQKAQLADELKEKQSELCADVFGNGFARKIHLSNFRRNKEEWMKLQKTSESAAKYFEDIVPSKRQKK